MYHAGYPIMGPLYKQKKDLTKSYILSKDDWTWGMFHELGHNQQYKNYWSVEGAGECSNNWWSIVMTEVIIS